MEKIEELLPGIEHFLCDVLSKEKLSSEAQERCKYFLERLEILKLPPTIPPRPKPEEGSETKSEETEKNLIINSLPAAVITKGDKHRPNAKKHNSAPVQGNETEAAVQTSDFAAFQRALARSLANPDSLDTEHSDSEEGKVYDDIDNSLHGDDMEDDEGEEADLYEIPVTQTPDESPQSVEPIIRVIHCGNADDASSEEASSPQPRKPPLPPRKETVSDPLLPSASPQDSGSSQHKVLPPRLPARPQLATRSEIYAMTSEKSEHTDDNTDEELMSYESNDIEHDFELLSKLSIKLPKTLKKIKKMRNGRKSHSSSQWNLSQPFKSLEDVLISGELHLKRKLTWNKRLVAVSAGRLICYKSEREPRPGLVVTLTGYEVTCTEREGRHGYELKLTHPMSDTYHFAVDCRDSAQTWMEVIKCVAESKPVPNRPPHLTRALSGQSDSGMGSRNDVRDSGSNLSNVSSEHGSHEENLHRRTFIDDLGLEKSNHLGLLASRASHFLETLGRKRQARKPSSEIKLSRLSLNSSPKKRQSTPSSDASPDAGGACGEKLAVLSEDVRWQEISIKCKSYLNVYSSFNKRPWGKRWCLVRLHTFECYQNHNSKICELNFLLKDCIVRSAKKETKSELGLMILNNNIEKITVEALNAIEMRTWLSVLMEETATDVVPDGLAQYFTEQPYSDITLNRQSSLIYFRPRESNYESCDQNLDLEDNVFSEEFEKESEVLSKGKRKEESLKNSKEMVKNGHLKTERIGNVVSEEPEALNAQNGQCELPDTCGAKPVSGRSPAISAARFSEYLQEITETCSTDSTTGDRNSATSPAISSLASPEKSSGGTDVSENHDPDPDPLYSWNPQYRSSELLSEKDIEALMQSWSVKNKIFMLEEKQYADIHSKADVAQNGGTPSSRLSVGPAPPTSKLFVSMSRSANYLSRYALDSEDELEAPPTNNHNCLRTPPTQNISSNGFVVGE